MCLTAFCINSFVSDLTFDAFLSFTFLIAFLFLFFFHHGAKDILLALDAGNLNNIKCRGKFPFRIDSTYGTENGRLIGLSELLKKD